MTTKTKTKVEKRYVRDRNVIELRIAAGNFSTLAIARDAEWAQILVDALNATCER